MTKCWEDKRLQSARNHDILACWLSILFNSMTVRISLPFCLRMNEHMRMYFLQHLASTTSPKNSLKFIKFSSYEAGYFYISDIELELISKVLRTFNQLLSLTLHSVANSDLAQTISDHCESLVALDLSNSWSLADEGASILSGEYRLVKKGPLIKTIKNSSDSNSCKFKDSIRSLTISRTRISIAGISYLSKNYGNKCQIHL